MSNEDWPQYRNHPAMQPWSWRARLILLATFLLILRIVIAVAT